MVSKAGSPLFPISQARTAADPGNHPSWASPGLDRKSTIGIRIRHHPEPPTSLEELKGRLA